MPDESCTPQIIDLRPKVIKYVLDRKCSSGGFCFYKLDEPNGFDTWYALSSLDLMRHDFQDGLTINYLKDIQHPDGSYDNIYAAYYAIRSLALFDETPSVDPRPYVKENLEHYRFDVERLPAEVVSIFKRTSYLVDLCVELDMDTDALLRDNIVNFILQFQNEDGGFGHRVSTLHETAQALLMLRNLHYPIGELEADTFIRKCEVPFYGFTDIPNTTMSFLEYVYAGVLTSYLLSRKPIYRHHCMEFVLNCQTRSGGFSRTQQGGIATMEYTWYGLNALAILSFWTACEADLSRNAKM